MVDSLLIAKTIAATVTPIYGRGIEEGFVSHGSGLETPPPPSGSSYGGCYRMSHRRTSMTITIFFVFHFLTKVKSFVGFPTSISPDSPGWHHDLKAQHTISTNQIFVVSMNLCEPFTVALQENSQSHMTYHPIEVPFMPYGLIEISLLYHLIICCKIGFQSASKSDCCASTKPRGFRHEDI